MTAGSMRAAGGVVIWPRIPLPFAMWITMPPTTHAGDLAGRDAFQVWLMVE